MTNPFDGLSNEQLAARTVLKGSTYRFTLRDKIALDGMTQSIKERLLDDGVQSSDVLRALVRFALGNDITDPTEQAEQREVTRKAIIEAMRADKRERAEIMEELTRRGEAVDSDDSTE